MNIQHLRYAVAVAEYGSVTEAAEKLYMGQPNLSRAIKELENELGIRIFERSSRGIAPTQQGEEFLYYARSILSQFDEMTVRYQQSPPERPAFRISVPRASYIAHAFVRFAETQPAELEMDYKETNALRAIRNVSDGLYPLGIVRYQATYERYFLQTFAENHLTHEELWSFRYVALLPKKHPAAEKQTLCLGDLRDSTEIRHGDIYVPSLPKQVADEKRVGEKCIQIYERGSQYDLLCAIPRSFMWVSPVPQALLDRYQLVQRPCDDFMAIHRDVLIHKSDYHKTPTDEAFWQTLLKVRDEVRLF